MAIEVHIDVAGAPIRVGTLHPASRGPAVAFEYDRSWFDRDGAFAIDPTALPLQPGAQHGAVLFGALQDCGPDRWGRVLIERAVRKKVLEQRPFRDIDYVLALDDASRLGALRFRNPDGPFLANTTGRLPPVIRLAALLRATDAIHRDTETAADLRFLLGEGSPLGGARPKSAIVLPDGALAIAKFRKPDDTRDIAAGEILALSIATAAGIRTAAHQLVRVGRSNAALITRFDRQGSKRIPFLSAASLVGASERDAGSYVAIAEAIRQFGDDVRSDLKELWRRMVFSLLVSNCDDHLRNHGFLMHAPGHWSLSPAYDVNPVPEVERGHGHQTPLSEGSDDFSLEHALTLAESFGLGATNAKTILREVAAAVGKWQQIGKRLRLAAATLASYASAFHNPCRDEVKRLLRS